MLPRLALLAASCLLALSALPASASAGSPESGKIRFINEAGSDFDQYTRSPSAHQASFMRNRYYRQKTYAPYFDSRTSWYGGAWAYKDLYAAYRTDSDDEAVRRDWILKDGAGNRMFIPWGCEGGTCPQYAADITNPAFRAHWIAQARETLAKGYRGLFIDDVNLEFRVGNGNGDEVPPIDPRTGRQMTHAAWRGYVADFVTQIRAALPGAEIAHNPIWFAGHDDPDTARTLLAADWIDLERGVSDDGLGAGGGRYGFETFLEHIDWLQARGKAVLFDAYTTTREGAEYNMATYFLVNGTRDGLRTNYRHTPENWWSGYDVQLGAPTGRRYESDGLLRRDFQKGYVLVNQPGHRAVTVRTPGAAGPDGVRRDAVRLAGAQGAVVLGDPAKAVKIILKPVVAPAVRGRTASRGTTIKVRGLVKRGRKARASNAKVRIRLERRIKRRWKHVRTRTSKANRKGNFAKLFKRLPRGKYRIKVRAATKGARKSTRTRTFRVKR